jgi:hypothetical protein
VRSQTPALIPIFASVLEDAEEQLPDAKTKEKLVELVKYLHKQNPAMLGDHQVLLAIANS